MSRRKSTSRTLRSHRSFRPTCERLEERLSPVVGGATYVPPVVPGTTPYDGVVSILDPTGAWGTGSLLSDGLHILTAGHVIRPLQAEIVGFNLPQLPGAATPRTIPGTINITVPANAALQPVAPGYAFPRNDLGILSLPDQANPAAVNTFEVAPYYAEMPIPGAQAAPGPGQIGYTLRPGGGPGDVGPVGSPFTFVGYGWTGTGTTGSDPATPMIKRLGYNTFDSPLSILNNRVQLVSLAPTGGGANPAGGNFRLQIQPPPVVPGAALPAVLTTANIPFNATAQQVQAAINALGAGLAGGTITVTGGSAWPANLPPAQQSQIATTGNWISWFLSYGGAWATSTIPNATILDGVGAGMQLAPPGVFAAVPATVTVQAGRPSEVQSFTIAAVPTGGNFVLRFAPPAGPIGPAPAPVQVSISGAGGMPTAQQIQNALWTATTSPNPTPGYTPLANNVLVTQPAGAAAGQFFVTFVNQLSNTPVPLITRPVNALTNAAGAVNVTLPAQVIAASAAAGYGGVTYDFDSGSPRNDSLGLLYNLQNLGVTQRGDAIQRVTLGPAPGAATQFTLTFTPMQTGPAPGGGWAPPAAVTTAPIPWNADPPAVLAALRALAPLAGNVTVPGAGDGVYDITFNGGLANTDVNQLTGMALTAAGAVVGPLTGITTTQRGVTDNSTANMDSGAPAFINGVIAAVNSFGRNGLPNPSPQINANRNSYGKIGVFVSVAHFLNSFINPTLNAIHPSSGQLANGATGVASAQAYNLVLDMAQQALGVQTNAGAAVADPVTITISNVNGNLVLNVSDTVAGTQLYQGTYFTGVASDISNLTVRGVPGGNTTFQVLGNLGLSNANQTITVPANPAPGPGDTFRLQFSPPGGGARVTTAPIAWNAAVAAVQAALNAATDDAGTPGYMPLNGNCVVAGAPGAWTIQLQNAMANNPPRFVPVNLVGMPGGVKVTSGTLTITGGAGVGGIMGNNTVILGLAGAGNLDDLAGTNVVINGGAGANNRLVINDRQAPGGRTYNMAANAVLTNVLDWGAASTITFNNVQDFTLNVGNQGNTINLGALTGGTPSTINGGTGRDIINVQATSVGSPAAINAGGSTTTVNVGSTLTNASTLGNVLANVTVSGAAVGTTTLYVNDQGAAQGQIYTVTRTTVTRGGSGTITYGGLSQLTLNTSGAAPAGTTTTNVQSTRVPTYINCGAGNNNVNVTNNGSLAGIVAPVYVTGGGAGTNRLNVDALANPQGGLTQSGAPPAWVNVFITPYSSISIGGSAPIKYRRVDLSYTLPDVRPLPANQCKLTTPNPVDPTGQTTIVTGSLGDTVRFDLTTSLLTSLVTLDDRQGLATAQLNQGDVRSTQVAFLSATDLSVTGGSFDVLSPVSAADASVSAGTLTVFATQTLAVAGTIGLTGGTTHVAGGTVADAGNFSQAGSAVLSIDLASAMPTPIVVSGSISLSGVLQLIALSGFDPPPGTVVTLLHNVGAAPVSGQFQGLPEGAVIAVNNVLYVLSYQGGSNGQDVVLTAGSGPPYGVPVANSFLVPMSQGQTAHSNLVAHASDSDGDRLTAFVVAPPGYGSVVYNAATGLFDYTPTSSSYTGLDSFTWKVNDGIQDSNTATVTILVSPLVVTLENPGDQTNLAGSAVSVILYGSSTSGATPTYTAVGLPPGLTLGRGVISGTLHNDSAGNYVVTVTAHDPTTSGTTTDATQTFTWIVNPPIVTLDNPGDQTNLAGSPVLVTLYGSSTDGAMLTWSATGLPPGLALANGLITGTPRNDSAGNYVVTVTASDPTAHGTALDATQTFTWIINPPIVTLDNPGDQTNLAGSAVSVTLYIWSTDGATLTWSATGLPPGLILANGMISGTLPGDAAGRYVVTVTATDPTAHGTALNATQTFTWTVSTPSVDHFTHINGFDGIFAAQGGNTEPPDSDGCVGPSSYIAQANTAVGIYNKSTGAAIAGPINVNSGTFFASVRLASAFAGDPVTVYNDITGRFGVGDEDFNHGVLYFAISNNSNPTTLDSTSWSFFRYTVTQPGITTPDYPKIGYNADGFVVSYNQFGGSFNHAAALAIANNGTSPGIQTIPGGTAIFTAAPPPCMAPRRAAPCGSRLPTATGAARSP